MIHKVSIRKPQGDIGHRCGCCNRMFTPKFRNKDRLVFVNTYTTTGTWKEAAVYHLDCAPQEIVKEAS